MTSYNNGYGNSRNDDSDTGSIVVGSLFGLCASFFLWDALINFRKRLKILNNYAESGVEVPAILLSHHTTIHRTNCIETRRTHRFSYSYRVPGSDEMAFKNMTVTQPVCCQDPREIPSTRVFTVLVLPGFPLSGIHTGKVEARNENLGTGACSLRIFLSGAALVLMSSIAMDGFGVSEGLPSLGVLFAVFAVLNLAGATCTMACGDRWSQQLLRNGRIEPSSARQPNVVVEEARAVVVEEGPHTDVPFASAVEVPAKQGP